MGSARGKRSTVVLLFSLFTIMTLPRSDYNTEQDDEMTIS